LEPKILDYSFGSWVRRRRKALDLTQQELASRVGCSVATIVKIESDERRPSRQIAELLGQHLQIPTEQQEQFLRVARKEKNVEALGEETTGVPSRPVRSSRIPPSPGVLLGREVELAEIVRLVQEPHCRLLTLTGPGGIGKTHLAIHLGTMLANSGERLVAFISLAPVNGREQTVTAIADALGIVLYAASDRAEQLISYLQDKDLILVLDNFEHLAGDEECVDLIGEILRGAYNLKLIATSRQPLQLQAEWLFEVQGLPVPKTENPEELMASSAVMLFIQRASQAAIKFEPTLDNLSVIAQICELVEGLPLGIELAAAWVRTLSCREIAQEIQNSMDFLAISRRDLPERHRSMRATIEHSWKLLTSEEQKVLRRLSAFRGGFTRQAAERVAGASLADLQALVSKSLVRRSESGRYDIHELIHQYANDQLEKDAAEFQETYTKHSNYYADFLDGCGSALKGAGRAHVVSELISDLPNIRQAWQWAASHQQTQALSHAADTLFWLYESRSNCREGVPLYGKAVEGLQVQAPASEEWQLALAQALCYQGYFLFRQGRHPQGRDALKSSLSILEEIQDRDDKDYQMALSTTLAFLGNVTSVMGDFAEGDRLLQTALNMKEQMSDLWGCAFCLRQIGLAAHYRGEYARATEALEKSLAISRQIGNAWAIAAALNQLGLDAIAQGNFEQAHSYLQDGLERSQAMEDRASIAFALDGLGLVSAAQGNVADAHEFFRSSIALLNEIGEQGNLAQTLTHYGYALLRIGELENAHRHFLDAIAVARRAEITPILLEALVGEAKVRVEDGDLVAALAIAWRVSQHPSGSYVTHSRAEKLCAELRQSLTTEEIQRAQEKYKTIDAVMQIAVDLAM
jgi:predicted ATPase/DNA-binding XRE family transcriptional regulator/Tfp pilus assembly protein PilF